MVTKVESKSNEWQEQLLDVSRRSRLLHFSETKRQTLRLVDPDPSKLFDMLVMRSRSLVIPTPDPQLTLDLENTDGPARQEAATSIRAKEGQALFEAPNGQVEMALYTLRTRARTEFDERGVGVLYLAFGFLHWFEADQSNEESRSPLLLVPVDLQQEAPKRPYRLKTRDDDLVVNPTVQRVLTEQYRMALPDPPEADEWSLEAYLTEIEDTIRPQQRWWVDRSCYLSVFSFLKLAMYRDLQQGLAIAEAHPIIQALAGETSSFIERERAYPEIPVERLDDTVDPRTCFQILDADSSQMQAIELAKAGASFAVQGPPGTGKSQTIANIIAEKLAQGDRVLFVAEKAAALDVVYRRLEQAGLRDACLPLHSQKANKREVVAELARVYLQGQSNVQQARRFDYDRLVQRRNTLNQYVRELHLVREPLGKSVREAIAELEVLHDVPDVEYSIGDVSGLDLTTYQSMLDAMRRLSTCAETIHGLDNNPWRGSLLAGDSPEVQRVTSARLRECDSRLESALIKAKDLALALGLDALDMTIERGETYVELGRLATSLVGFVGRWLDVERTEDLRALLARGRSLYQEEQELNDELAQEFEPSFVGYDVNGLAQRLESEYRTPLRFLNRRYRTERRVIAQHTHAKACPAYGRLRALVPRATKLAAIRNDIQRLESDLSGAFEHLYAGPATDWVVIEEGLAALERLRERFPGGIPQGLRQEFPEIVASPSRVIDLISEVCTALSAAEKAGAEVTSWFSQTAPLYSAFFNCRTTPLEQLEQAVHRLLQSMAQLEGWTKLSRAEQACSQVGLEDVVPSLAARRIPGDAFEPSLRRRILTRWVDGYVSTIGVLRDLDVGTHSLLRNEFRQLDEQVTLAARQALAARIAERKPPPADTGPSRSQPSLLLREHNKKRRLKSLRSLFSEIPDLLLALKPCLLMSPLSVGQFLPLGTIAFDTVIFDEASQVKPEDAVGSIMRAPQAIIVGDKNQLPPTSFFEAALDDDYDASEDDSDEDRGAYESILDLFLGVSSLHQPMLKWHYRSKKEGLIAFSNQNFYENKLITFPSPRVGEDGTGVSLEYVPNGIYDRSRTRVNRPEAERVVEIVLEHARSGSTRSMGVVAFNQAQAQVIDRELWARRSREPALEAFFRRDLPEPFFVKNLENVQGDERDIMLFSIAYGKDRDGKLTLNFGPINTLGGQRRLNVAVSRAREQVIVVTSLKAEDIDLSRSTSEGVRLLRQYLDYAERGLPALAMGQGGNATEPESPFEEQVARLLESKGYTVHKQVGCSGYRIDLAVVHPEHPGKYVLGIECDGASYHRAATARERDRLRESILTSLGWRIYRIWSTDWFRSRARASEELLAAVRDAVVACGTGDDRNAGTGTSVGGTKATPPASTGPPSRERDRLAYEARMTLPIRPSFPPSSKSCRPSLCLTRRLFSPIAAVPLAHCPTS